MGWVGGGWGGWEGWVGGAGGWEAGGGLHRPTGPFGVAMSPRSASHRPRHDKCAYMVGFPIFSHILFLYCILLLYVICYYIAIVFCYCSEFAIG